MIHEAIERGKLSDIGLVKVALVGKVEGSNVFFLKMKGKERKKKNILRFHAQCHW